MDGRHDTILVVDSDVIARTVIAGYLRDCGYIVIEADNGEEALIALQHPKFNISAMLCDVELGGTMNGFGVARWVRENRPGVQVLLATASEKAASSAAELCEQGPALGKPYHPKIVVERIKRLRAGKKAD
jgi:CheY-like chemotaxis protein